MMFPLTGADERSIQTRSGCHQALESWQGTQIGHEGCGITQGSVGSGPPTVAQLLKHGGAVGGGSSGGLSFAGPGKSTSTPVPVATVSHVNPGWVPATSAFTAAHAETRCRCCCTQGVPP